MPLSWKEYMYRAWMSNTFHITKLASHNAVKDKKGYPQNGMEIVLLQVGFLIHLLKLLDIICILFEKNK